LATFRLKFVQSYRDRHGRIRHYLRRPGHKRIALPGLPGSEEFMSTYGKALAATPITNIDIEIGTQRTKPGSVNAMAIGYLNSTAFAGLKPNSKAQYTRDIEHIRRDFGDMPMRDLKRQHVVQMIDDRASTPCVGRALLRSLRLIINYALQIGTIENDPTVRLRARVPDRGGYPTWSQEQITQFRNFYELNAKERLAIELLICTALRCNDVVRLGRQHIRDGILMLGRTEKTGTPLTIEVSDELAAAIEAAPPNDALVFLVNEWNRPFTASGFSRWFRKAAKRAGLAGCSAHGVRKASATELAEADCTAPEIAAVTAHRSLAQVQRYIDGANRAKLAANAVAKLKAKRKLKAVS
jgi:integrase